MRWDGIFGGTQNAALIRHCQLYVRGAADEIAQFVRLPSSKIFWCFHFLWNLHILTEGFSALDGPFRSRYKKVVKSNRDSLLVFDQIPKGDSLIPPLMHPLCIPAPPLSDMLRFRFLTGGTLRKTCFHKHLLAGIQGTDIIGVQRIMRLIPYIQN